MENVRHAAQNFNADAFSSNMVCRSAVRNKMWMCGTCLHFRCNAFYDYDFSFKFFKLSKHRLAIYRVAVRVINDSRTAKYVVWCWWVRESGCAHSSQLRSVHRFARNAGINEQTYKYVIAFLAIWPLLLDELSAECFRIIRSDITEVQIIYLHHQSRSAHTNKKKLFITVEMQSQFDLSRRFFRIHFDIQSAQVYMRLPTECNDLVSHSCRRQLKLALNHESEASEKQWTTWTN